MKTMIFTLVLSTLFGTPAFASTWNYLQVGNDDTLFFFDADTVVKNREITTLWVKLVQTKTAERDGSWAATLHWRLNCSKRTIQTLGWSTYNREGKFIRSGEKSENESAVVPDSTGEGVLKIACEAKFPRDSSSNKFYAIKNNDVFQFTKNFADYLNSQQDNAPK